MSKAWDIIGDRSRHGVLIVADHASNLVPPGVHLGVGHDIMGDHIAFDIGTDGVARFMCQNAGFTAIMGAWSRLVVDLNRYAHEASVVPVHSDKIEIPGNVLTDEHHEERLELYYHPYHDRVRKLIAELEPRVVLSLHSFTDWLRADHNVERPWHIGVLYNDYEEASKIALAALAEEDLIVGDQLPYSGKLLNATMNQQCESIGQPYFGIEIRQDLIPDEEGQQRFADILVKTCNKIVAALA